MTDVEPQSLDLGNRILQMRNSGASWADIERALDVNRQQARYAYQKAKRVERRKARRTQD